MKDEKNLKFHEVEVKFKVNEANLNSWKQIVEKLDNLVEYIHTESDDIYYTKGDQFLRYRFDPLNREKRSEITYKIKTNDKNNIIRQEVNLRVDKNKEETVKEFITGLGYKHNFKISKYVDIYRFKDVTLPFYTVIDENGNRDSFLEIEVNEDVISSLSEEECWDILRKYEKILEPLGITHQKRLKKSLFEMYRKSG